MTSYKSDKEKWGICITWADTTAYSSRILHFNKDLGTQSIYHKKRDITLFILEGRVLLVVEGKKKILEKGDVYNIRPKIIHRIIAFQEDAIILESGTELIDDVVVVEE